MSLIQCPECHREISDKAPSCPACGYPINFQQSMVSAAPEADQTDTPEDEAESFGSSVAVESADLAEGIGVAEPSVQQPAVEQSPAKKKKRLIVIAIASFAVLALIAVAVVLIIQNNNNRRMQEEAAQAEAEAERVHEEYISNLKLANILMLDGAAKAETLGGLAHDVWYDTIYDDFDTDTHKYITSDDFNDSLRNLYADAQIQIDVQAIEDNQTAVKNTMQALLNPPDDLLESYEIIKETYDIYVNLTDLAISPKGSLQTFTDNYNTYDTDFLASYKKLEIYLPQE